MKAKKFTHSLQKIIMGIPVLVTMSVVMASMLIIVSAIVATTFVVKLLKRKDKGKS